MEFEWNEEKNAKTKQERGFGFDYVAKIFKGRVLERVDNRKDYGETRIAALGEVEGTIYYVVYTKRNGAKRIISARKANENERREYYQN